MPHTTLNVRLSGALSEFVAINVGETGVYENVSEYIRDLIRRDKSRAEEKVFEQLKAELSLAFSTPESSYVPLKAADIITQNQSRQS
jgi:antitoxin ParD1/3/4